MEDWTITIRVPDADFGATLAKLGLVLSDERPHEQHVGEACSTKDERGYLYRPRAAQGGRSKQKEEKDDCEPSRDTSRLLYWIKERDAIRLRRAAGQPRPWSDNPIFREWSFCNVRRECDRITTWIREKWREPHAGDPDLWFAMAVARLVNWTDSLAAIGYPVPWDRGHFIAVLQARAARGEKVWGDAYNISNGGQSVPKVEHVAGVLDKLWARRKPLRPRPDDSLQSFYGRLKDMDGFASFMAAQVVADTKFAEPLRSARDWWTFAAPGPGSKRGLNRVLGRPVNAPWRDDDTWRAALARVHEAIAADLESIGVGRLCGQDLQNCLCELDKFERVRLGEGKPKRRFVPHGGSSDASKQGQPSQAKATGAAGGES